MVVANPSTVACLFLSALSLALWLFASPGSASADLRWSPPQEIGLKGINGGVSCPTATVCVAAALNQVAFSPDARAGSSAWHAPVILPGDQPDVTSISCSSDRLCVVGGGRYLGTPRELGGTDDRGWMPKVWVSSKPSGQAADWREVELPPREAHPYEIVDVSCATTSFCAAVTGTTVYVARDLARDPAGWTSVSVPTRIEGTEWESIACPTAGTCLIGGEKQIASSATPATAGTWTVRSASTRLHAISCPSLQYCGAAGDDGVHVGPATDPDGWRVQPGLGGYYFYSLACPSQSFCVGGELQGQLQQTDMPGSWTDSLDDRGRAANSSSNASILGVACATNRLCLALNEHGRIQTGAPLPTIRIPGGVDLSRLVARVAIVGARPATRVRVRARLGDATFGVAYTTTNARGTATARVTLAHAATLRSRRRLTFSVRLTTPAGHTITLNRRTVVR